MLSLMIVGLVFVGLGVGAIVILSQIDEDERSNDVKRRVAMATMTSAT